MIFRKNSAKVLILFLPFLASCSENSNSAESADIATMDSVSYRLEKTNADLDDKTMKLEVSLEKANKELATTQP